MNVKKATLDSFQGKELNRKNLTTIVGGIGGGSGASTPQGEGGGKDDNKEGGETPTT